jgi:hypothetical protein
MHTKLREMYNGMLIFTLNVDSGGHWTACFTHAPNAMCLLLLLIRAVQLQVNQGQ